ncbi:type II toxin-antitoxin system death-on-curing family toxin [Parasphingorhabdus flavimaris]|jgi:death on curing protein|uniref:Type II toxin-antitoxin system death-on-curing family toxin n=1 Tax=Parasphingorhabdus flavimaris TaxID=266812 RepID=A0ABX2MYQ3_9SPHN|nr:type II toxin-antitoxin system death-on-curing family toxin [Parasphingorhabdus flavimaris]NVD26585.1 type II toxin-antitoxin system death-on-curing family toxin [Parasphingorhabdus flavimaris]|tara:strand:- start:3880 stop:4278 length:399 start_codon:yes stop_codon:yes gene_type:complete
MTDGRIEPIWLDAEIALAIHDRQLAEHGGPSGIRDHGLLESALAKPVNTWGYGEDDLCALAAAYAFGVARNHPFTDGNKRTAWVLARAFLVLNDCQLVFEREEAIETVQTLAAGELAEEELAKWFRDHIRHD